MNQHQNKQGAFTLSTSFWVKVTLFVGFFFQIIIAFVSYIILSNLNMFEVWGYNMAILFDLLLSFMPAVSLGFLTANFIVHKIPLAQRTLSDEDYYKSTQRLLWKLFVVSLLFVVFAGSLIVWLMEII